MVSCEFGREICDGAGVAADIGKELTSALLIRDDDDVLVTVMREGCAGGAYKRSK